MTRRHTHTEEQLETLLQGVGDAIAGVVEQMLKGNWRDDHGHYVTHNIHMMKLGGQLDALSQFRQEHMGYVVSEAAYDYALQRMADDGCPHA